MYGVAKRWFKVQSSAYKSFADARRRGGFKKALEFRKEQRVRNIIARIPRRYKKNQYANQETSEYLDYELSRLLGMICNFGMKTKNVWVLDYIRDKLVEIETRLRSIKNAGL